MVYRQPLKPFEWRLKWLSVIAIVGGVVISALGVAMILPPGNEEFYSKISTVLLASAVLCAIMGIAGLIFRKNPGPTRIWLNTICWTVILVHIMMAVFLLDYDSKFVTFATLGLGLGPMFLQVARNISN